MEGLKQMTKGAFDFASNIVMGAVKAISGFLQGFVTFFDGVKAAIGLSFGGIMQNFALMRADIEQKLTEINQFFEAHKTVILSVAGAITLFFLPAIIKVGVEAAIAGGILAAQFIAQMVRMMTFSVVVSAVLIGQFVAAIIKTGVEAAISAGIMTTQFIASIIRMGIEAGIAAATGVWDLIVSVMKFTLESWAAVGALVAKSIQLGIATAAMVFHTVVTWLQVAGTVALTAATWLLNVALAVLTSPIFLVIAAIVALIAIGYLLITHWDTVKQTAQRLGEAMQKVWEGIKRTVEDNIGFIGRLIGSFNPIIRIGLELPNIEQAWRDLNNRGASLGVPGFRRMQSGGIVPGSPGQPVPIIAHGGERVTPYGTDGVGSGNGGGVVFQVSIGLYAGTETEKRNIGKELYAAVMKVAMSQNKTVAEYMGA